MHFLKKFLKTIFVILIIALIGFCGYRYYKLKNDGKLEEVFAKDETNIEESYYGKDYSSSSSSNSNNSNKEEEEENKNENDSSDGKYVVEEKNYDGYYNQFNFDNRLLLYEGRQENHGTHAVFDLLIVDADDPMFSKPSVVFNNFSGLKTNEITASNIDEYKDVLNTAKNSLGNESSCTFSFEYNNLKTYVNKIIITKN